MSVSEHFFLFIKLYNSIISESLDLCYNIKRISKHNKNINSNIYLQSAILKYGRENFIIEIIEYPDITLPKLIEIEQGLLDEHYGLPLCYNISPSANGLGSGENHPSYGKKCYIKIC